MLVVYGSPSGTTWAVVHGEGGFLYCRRLGPRLVPNDMSKRRPEAAKKSTVQPEEFHRDANGFAESRSERYCEIAEAI